MNLITVERKVLEKNDDDVPEITIVRRMGKKRIARPRTLQAVQMTTN